MSRTPKGGPRAFACASFVRGRSLYEGTVVYRGEHWRAESPVPVVDNQPVFIEKRRGLVLRVAPAGAEGSAALH